MALQPIDDIEDTLEVVDPFKLVGTTLLGKYRIDKIIGEGGFGVVYGGTHLVIDAPIAIKRMKPLGGTLKEQARAAERFLREAKILFSLTHPSIVRLYDVGTVTAEVGTVPYVVLEYLDGGSLDREIATRAASIPPRHFTPKELLRIFKPLLQGVEFLHANGVAHHDLKPSNLMLVQSSTRGPQAKVVDFGIARWIGDGVRTVGVKTMAFTPRYAAPEQWDSSLGATGAATDVFALGLILAEAITLKPALAAVGPAQLFIEVMRPRKIDIASLRPDLPAELGKVLEHATSVDPKQRFATAGELLEALEATINLRDEGTPSSRRVHAAPRASEKTPATVAAPESTLEAVERPGMAPSMAHRGAPAIVSAAPPPAVPSRVMDTPEIIAPRRTPAMMPTTPPIRDYTPRILACDDDHLTAIWGPVFLTVWKKVTHVEAARAIQFALRDLAAATPGKRVACLTVIEEKAELPNGDARTAVANVLRFNSESIVCSANVMEGEGFRAAAVRGVVTGIALVARQPFPNHVFASVPLSAAWICRALEKAGAGTISADDLISRVEEVRAIAEPSSGKRRLGAHVRAG